MKTNIPVIVNENAYDTWLDPYIGWTFYATRITKKYVYWLMDCGNGVFRREKATRNRFYILDTKQKTLQHVRDEIASDYGYKNWEVVVWEFMNKSIHTKAELTDMVNDIAVEYSKLTNP